MLSIRKMSIRNADYYLDLACEDYYLKGGEPPGQWHGQGAEALGLRGNVSPEVFHHLFNGFAPDGQRPLVQNAGKHEGYHRRVPGWDMTFSAPKSVSVCWALANEPMREAIRKCHEQAVRSTLNMIEREAGITRSGSRGWNRQAAKLCFAMFEHGTSRAQDPQLHTHALCFNLGQRGDQGWGALQSEQLYELKMAMGALYRCELAYMLQRDIFMPVEQSGVFFEIKGVDQAIQEFFSTRRAEIVEYCRKHGGYDALLAEEAAMATRSQKAHAPRDTLLKEWAEAAAPSGWNADKVLGLQQSGIIRGDWNARFRQLSADVEAALRASPVKPTKAQLLQAVAEASQASGFSAKQVMAAAIEGQKRSNVRLSKSNEKPANRFREQFAEAKSNSQAAEAARAKAESARRVEEMAKKWKEATESNKAKRVANEERERTRRQKKPWPRNHLSTQDRWKRRQEFAVLKIKFSGKNRRYPFKTIDFRFFNVDCYKKRVFPYAPFWHPASFLKATALAVGTDLAPHKIVRRFLIPLRNAKHAAIAQIREIVKSGFKAGARMILLSDERVEALGEKVKEGQRFLRQLSTPHVLVGKSDAQAWRGLLDHWEQAGGVTRPDQNLILTETRAAADRLNNEVQKERRRQGRIGLRPIEIGESTFHLNDRVVFQSSRLNSDIKNLEKVSPGDVGTVVNIRENRITIRTDDGVRVEFSAKEAPDVRLAYALAHVDAGEATPRKAFIYFEGNRPEQEYEAIKRRAVDSKTRVYVGPDLAECFTQEGLREIRHRIAIREMEDHDAKRDKAWEQESANQKAKTDAKSHKAAETPSQGRSEANAQKPNESEIKRPARSFWDSNNLPEHRHFEEERDRQEKQARIERAIAKREGEEEFQRKKAERMARWAAKQERKRSQEGKASNAQAESRSEGRSPFKRASDTGSYWVGKAEVRESPFKAPREEEDLRAAAFRAMARQEAAERLKQAEQAKKEGKATQGEKRDGNDADDTHLNQTPVWGRGPFAKGAGGKWYWTGKGEVMTSPFAAERLEEDVLRYIEEERRYREGLAKRREMAKGATQATTQQASSQSQSQTHSH